MSPLPRRIQNGLNPEHWIPMLKFNGQTVMVLASEVQRIDASSQLVDGQPMARLVFDVDEDGQATEALTVRLTIPAARDAIGRADL